MSSSQKPESPSGAGTRSVTAEIEIDAPVEAVWKALTEAAELERWFPLEARVEPGEGGKILMSWGNEYQDEAAITAWEPQRHLRVSWGSPPERPVQIAVDYYLEGRGGRTVLRLVHSGFPADPSWDGWFEGTERGWSYELLSLRHYLERHRGRDRDLVYLRRRVRAPAEEIWRRLVGPEGLASRGRLAGIGAEARYGCQTATGEELAGVLLLDDGPDQLAATVEPLADALLRVSVERCFGEPEEPQAAPVPVTGEDSGAAGMRIDPERWGADESLRDATLWLESWAAPAQEVAGIRARWQDMLGRLFPEGRSV